MSASQRAKGAAGEREFCAFLRAHGFELTGRVLGQARDGGGDIALPPMLYEVKRYHKIAVRKWLDQAVQSMVNYEGSEMPCVAMREDGRTEWMVLMRAEDLMKLLRLS